MTDTRRKEDTGGGTKSPEKARRRAESDDPTRQTERQLDDNQDDLGRDANDPRRVGNEINKKGH